MAYKNRKKQKQHVRKLHAANNLSHKASLRIKKSEREAEEKYKRIMKKTQRKP